MITYPAEFKIVRVFTTSGTGHEAVWTGDVWWLRHGAVLTCEECDRWESIPLTADCIFHAQHEVVAAGGELHRPSILLAGAVGRQSEVLGMKDARMAESSVEPQVCGDKPDRGE